MPVKSTQTNKYETACFLQEAPTSSELDTRGYKLKKSIEGIPYCEFTATLQTFNCYNRMGRRYDAQNVVSVINGDERIQTLKRQNKWRGEWNHPNSPYKDKTYSDIRMTIPEPRNTSHFINKDHLEGDRLKAVITTHPGTADGRSVTSEIVDLGSVPSFSVRLLGNLIPNAPANQPNIRVSKVITFDLVDFPSHPGADADISARIMESANIVFMKELAQYCAEQDEGLRVVCESFQFSPEEIMGISNGSIIINSADAHVRIPLKGEIRREALDFIMKKGGF